MDILRNTTLNVKGWKNAFHFFNNYYPVFWAHIKDSVTTGTYNKVFPTSTSQSAAYKRYYGSQFCMKVSTYNEKANHYYSEFVYCRVETRTRDNGTKLVIDDKKVRSNMVPYQKDTKNMVMLLGCKGYYSVFDNSWVNDKTFYVLDPEQIPAKTVKDKNGKIRHYKARTKINRVYNLEALLHAGKIWQYVPEADESISGNPFMGTETRISQPKDIFFDLGHANDDMFSWAKSPEGITIPYDPRPSTYLWYADDGDEYTGHTATIVQFAERFYDKRSKEYKVLVNKVHRYLTTFQEKNILKPLVIEGKTYFVASKKVNVDQTKENKEQQHLDAEELHRVKTRIRTWLVRHNWTGTNEKWTSDELFIALTLKTEHTEKGE